jgi:hypothetical protein
MIQCHATPPENLRLDDWQQWRNATDRTQTVCMAARKFAGRIEPGKSRKVFVYHYWADAETFANGSPKQCNCTELNVWNDQQ